MRALHYDPSAFPQRRGLHLPLRSQLPALALMAEALSCDLGPTFVLYLFSQPNSLSFRPMGHNRIYKGGPTLDDCKRDGVTHLRICCMILACTHQALIALDLVPGPKNVPVNHLPWRCKKCRQTNISVSAVKEEQPVPVLDLKAMRPHPRRAPTMVVVHRARHAEK
jgi:hypothetical protein